VNKYHRHSETIDSSTTNQHTQDPHPLRITGNSDYYATGNFEGSESIKMYGGRQHYQIFSNKQPCWSNFKNGTGNFEVLDPIGFENDGKVYLVRLMSNGSPKFGTFCPSQNKLVAFGDTQSSETTSAQLLNVKPGTLGWALTSQSVYRWKIPRNALIVGRFAGIPYALHKKPTYYTICRPDLSLGVPRRKLVLGVANSQTGLCTAEFGGQVVHFTRFHILTQLHATAGLINAMETCSNTPSVRTPISIRRLQSGRLPASGHPHHAGRSRMYVSNNEYA
jgi:hypothetical protein